MNFPIFPHFPESSKLLVFTSDITLEERLSKTFISRLNEFIQVWSSHGSRLTADALLISNRVLFIAVDESKQSASGCSVDALINFIKVEGVSSGVDWFNRHQVLYRTHHNSDLTSDWLVSKLEDFRSLIKEGSLAESVQILNTTVTCVKDARNLLIQPFSQSWLSRF
jgi:hypothetical protein